MAAEFQISNQGRTDQTPSKSYFHRTSACTASFSYAQKVVAEFIATFLLIFMGCGSVMVDKKSNGSITHLGVSLVWGMAVTILIYTVGHISGAHLNSAVTMASAIVGRFPFKQVPGYLVAQISASIIAGFVLRGLFGNVAHVAATVPTGSVMQSFVMEIIITYCLMFVVSAVSSDHNAVKDMGVVAVGVTVAATVAIAGPISGASLNPSRSIGSAVSGNEFKSIWVYMVAPTLGAILGAYSYELIRTRNGSSSKVSLHLNGEGNQSDNLHPEMRC